MSINGPKIYFTIPIFGGIAVTQTLLTSFIVTLILCIGGILIGRKAGSFLAWRASILGGSILIAIGLEIWISNIFF